MKSRLEYLGLMSIVVVTMCLGNAATDAQSMDTAIKQEYQDYCCEIGDEFGICPEVLMAIIETESNGDASAIGADGDTGLCQIIPRFSNYSQKELLDAKTNIYACAEILSRYGTEYELTDALCAYNCGPYSKTFKKIVGTGEMTEYAKKIIDRAYQLEEIHGKHLCK